MTAADVAVAPWLSFQEKLLIEFQYIFPNQVAKAFEARLKIKSHKAGFKAETNP